MKNISIALSIVILILFFGCESNTTPNNDPKPQDSIRCEGTLDNGQQCLNNTTGNFCTTHISNNGGSNPTAPQCLGTTQKGTRCERRTNDTSGYCWQHK